MKSIRNIGEIAGAYNALLVDLWGCVHDGTRLYPDALPCLKMLHKLRKPVVFISNAPRRAAKAAVVLTALGVDSSLYKGVVTSGEAAFSILSVPGAIPSLSEKEMPGVYYFIGPERDADVLAGLSYVRTHRVQEADFLVNAGFGTDEQSTEDFQGLLQQAAKRRLPMACLNPDKEVVKITGERYPCAGVIAEAYEAMGGEVMYIGKPYPEIYARALDLLGAPARSHVLAIGDGLHTDVLGARNAGIASVLITGGLLGHLLHKSDEEILYWLAQADVQPDYVISALRW
ncbi:MAG: TIGR01459 family HAD-type hydrolase [Alphaproteobacteria bacterium]|nr:TIGR01459 family HAD-type hydrolase [Alphaproteobacteria bacterium]